MYINMAVWPVIVFDLETTGFLEDPNAVPTVGVLVTTNEGDVCHFRQHEMGTLANAIKASGYCAGFNVLEFDLPFLQRYTGVDLTGVKVFDPLAEIRATRGFDKAGTWKLQTIATYNLNICKSGDGANAVQLWKDGKIDELLAYCDQDVMVTNALIKRLWEQIELRGSATLKSEIGGVGEPVEVQIDLNWRTFNAPAPVAVQSSWAAKYEAEYKATYGQYASAWD